MHISSHQSIPTDVLNTLIHVFFGSQNVSSFLSGMQDALIKYFNGEITDKIIRSTQACFRNLSNSVQSHVSYLCSFLMFLFLKHFSLTQL